VVSPPRYAGRRGHHGASLTWVTKWSLHPVQRGGTNDATQGVALTVSACRNSRPSTKSNGPLTRVFSPRKVGRGGVTLVVLLLILVALWVVVLTPGLLKRRFEKRSTVSIDSFHEQLHLLERTGPKLVAPAYRLEAAEAASVPLPGISGYPAISSMPGRPNLVLLRPVNEALDGDLVDDGHGGHFERVGTADGGEQVDDHRRKQHIERRRRQERMARQRRRDLVLGLSATLVATGLLGMIGSLHLLWIFTALSGVALVGYLGLVAYAQTLTPAKRIPARPATFPSFSAAQSGLPDDRFDDDEEPRKVAAR